MSPTPLTLPGGELERRVGRILFAGFILFVGFPLLLQIGSGRSFV
jgi:hypothetical protein